MLPINERSERAVVTTVENVSLSSSESWMKICTGLVSSGLSINREPWYRTLFFTVLSVELKYICLAEKKVVC